MECLEITQKHSGSSQWPIFYLFDRPWWEITKMLFLWCVLIKKTNTAWHLVHFIQRGMGVWNLSTSAPLTGIELWRGRGTNPHQCHCHPRPVQTSTFVYSSLLGPCHICVKTKPHLQEHWLLQAVEGAETVVVFFFSLNFPLKYSSSTPHSVQQHTTHYAISSPAS